MPYCWALLLVTLETLRRSRVRARSKAKRMMRSQPTSVNRALDGDSLGRGRGCAAEAAYRLAVLADDTQSVGVVGLAQRAAHAGQEVHGRMLAHWSKLWQMASRRPHRLTWSGTPGQPTAPK